MKLLKGITSKFHRSLKLRKRIIKIHILFGLLINILNRKQIASPVTANTIKDKINEPKYNITV